MKMVDYLKTMKKLVDNFVLVGHPVSLDDLVSHTLTRLDSSKYNLVICRIEKLLSYEKRLEQLNASIASIDLGQPTANFASTRGGHNNNYNKNQSQQGYT